MIGNEKSVAHLHAPEDEPASDEAAVLFVRLQRGVSTLRSAGKTVRETVSDDQEGRAIACRGSMTGPACPLLDRVIGRRGERGCLRRDPRGASPQTERFGCPFDGRRTSRRFPLFI